MQMQPPSTNGNHTAPRSARGAVVVPPAAAPGAPRVTTFPPALARGGADEWLYTLGRATIFGLPLLRVVSLGVVLLALAWALRPLPGGGWAAGAMLLALGALVAARKAAARRAFVHFSAGAGEPAVAPEPLPASAKLPVYVWGELEVQGRVRSFAALPGFYRTFATREHALIGQVVSHSRLGVARISDLDEGLWYAFCTPAQIRSLHVGTLRWGRRRYPALALARRAERTGAGGRAHVSVETLYIAATDDATVRRMLADLLVEEGAAAAAAARGAIRA